MEEIKSFFNSNLFIALTTIIVGGFAIGLYIKQRRDNKRDIAGLIIQEIRYAENQIRIARDAEYNYRLANKLLPTSNWHNNIHFFIKNLKETDMDLISKFYSNAAYLDEIIHIISNQKSQMLIPINKKQTTPSSELGDDNNKQPLPLQEFELNANRILKEVSGKIEFVYNTPAVDKLRSISEKKWYQIL